MGPRTQLCRALPIAVAILLTALPAAAQREAHVEPPPTPDNREPELLVGVHLGGLFPIERADICPGDSLCVLGGGGSFGVEIERRWPMGIGIVVAYDAWFVEAGGVFELGVVQTVRAAVRYAFLYDEIIHPEIHIGAGALVFGDTFLVSTVGGALEAGVGAELELTESVSLTGGLEGWFFTTTPFTTGRDRTLRSPGIGLNAALQVNVGIQVVAASGPPT